MDEDKTVPKLDLPKMRTHKLSNLSTVLHFIEVDERVRLVGIGPYGINQFFDFSFHHLIFLFYSSELFIFSTTFNFFVNN